MPTWGCDCSRFKFSLSFAEYCNTQRFNYHHNHVLTPQMIVRNAHNMTIVCGNMYGYNIHATIVFTNTSKQKKLSSYVQQVSSSLRQQRTVSNPAFTATV